VDAEKLSFSPALSSVVLKALRDQLSVSVLLILCKPASQKANGTQEEIKSYGNPPKQKKGT
jgi:hypothetical protein